MNIGDTPLSFDPGSKYAEVADAAHGLPITHAELVNDLLTKHLTE